MPKAALTKVSQTALTFKPAPMEWRVHEIIIHIADSATNAALRARIHIIGPGGCDQDKLANELNYHDQSHEDAFETVRLVRKTMCEFLKKQSDGVFTHAMKHPEYAEP